MRILIVEDDAVSRLLLLTKLRKLGHEVIVAEDGEEGWQTFKKELPRLVITDWMMPKFDGLQLCGRIRAHENKQYVYIIMLTALVGKKNYMEGMDAGADDFLNKPVDMDELKARLQVAERILALQTTVRQLEGLLPICAYCKKIRDENNSWEAVEGYVSKRSKAKFSHGVCPTCYSEHILPQLDQLKVNRAAKVPKETEAL